MYQEKKILNDYFELIDLLIIVFDNRMIMTRSSRSVALRFFFDQFLFTCFEKKTNDLTSMIFVFYRTYFVFDPNYW